MSKFRFEGLSEFNVGERQRFKENITRQVREYKTEQEERVKAVSIEMPETIKIAESQVRSRLDMQWGKYTKDSPPAPKVFYISDEKWNIAIEGIKIKGADIFGYADAITGNVLIRVTPGQSDIALILFQAHEMSHAYKRTGLKSENDVIKVAGDNYFLEESHATQQEKAIGLSTAKDVLGARRVEKEMLLAKTAAQKNKNRDPRSSD